MLYMYFLRNFVIFQIRRLELIGCKLQLAMLCEGLILSEQDIVLNIAKGTTDPGVDCFDQ